MKKKSIEKLMEKLSAFQSSLSPEEQQAFGSMLELASKGAEELSSEDLDRVTGGYGLAKSQSSHLM